MVLIGVAILVIKERQNKNEYMTWKLRWPSQPGVEQLQDSNSLEEKMPELPVGSSYHFITELSGSRHPAEL